MSAPLSIPSSSSSPRSRKKAFSPRQSRRALLSTATVPTVLRSTRRVTRERLVATVVAAGLVILSLLTATALSGSTLAWSSSLDWSLSTAVDLSLVDVPSLARGLVYTAAANATVSNTTCFPHNTAAWLTGPRLGNTRSVTSHFVRQMTVELSDMLAVPGHARYYLEQTIAFASSRFCNDTQAGQDAASVRLWTVRLLYLATLYQQHSPAIQEATALYNNNNAATTEQCLEERSQKGIGRYDFECPDTKFIVAALSNNGLGANIRSGTTTVLLAGLMTNRTVVFVNNAPQGSDQYLQRPWALASCDRMDYQCFFLPPSPCTITHQQLQQATMLGKKETRRLLKKGELPADNAEQAAKVWILQLSFTPVLENPARLRESLHHHATMLIDRVPSKDPRRPVLLTAASELLEKANIDKRPGYNFAAANFKMNHALNFYAMRPLATYQAKMDETLEEIIPPNFDADTAFGLPIRGTFWLVKQPRHGQFDRLNNRLYYLPTTHAISLSLPQTASDKCFGESECLTFYQHMQGVAQLWKEYHNTTNTNSDPVVVFTSEATKMVQEQQEFASNTTLHDDFSFRFSFLTNHKDVTPDSGFVQDIRKLTNFTADESMLSAVTSLKFQLLPRVSLGNCCSNFHVLLSDFLMEGLGAASDNGFHCLQEFDDPRLKVCCGWHKQCKKDRAQALAVLANQTEATATAAVATRL